MKLIGEYLDGVKLIEPFVFSDARGSFVKPFHENDLSKLGIEMQVREEFFSISHQGVLRGMHFQTPPHAHSKLIYCSRGGVLDVVLDIRKASPTYGQAANFELSDENHYVVCIPKGFAHGFVSLSADSCLIYKTDCVYAPDSDEGILWDSFGFEWPITSSPMLSERDLSFPTLAEFESPF